MTARPRAGAASLVLAVALAGSSCRCTTDTEPSVPASTSATTSGATPATPPRVGRVALDLLDVLPGCDLDHRGLLLDGGTDALLGRVAWRWSLPAGIATSEHDGSTWARISDKSVLLQFTLTQPTSIFVAARVVGMGARSAGVLLDDQPLGTLALGQGQIKVAQTPTTTLPVDAGAHTITIRFTGRRGDADAFADVDWIRIGIPDEDTSTYGPPTLRDIVAKTAAIGGVPHRAIALRAPGAVRCPMRIPAGAFLRAAVGVSGTGEAEAELRLVRDGKEPEVIKRLRLTGGERATWTDIDVPLGTGDPGFAALELRAVSAPRGGRILFGDPAVVLPGPRPEPAGAARAVVVVVLDGVERSALPPWIAAGGRPSLATLTDLASSATTFERHRAPTTVVASVLATMLTGLPPRAHALGDLGARLPEAQTTIAEVARDASIRTAMFTGVPMTFRPFGFAPGWDRFVEHPPNGAAPATAPIDEAASFITETARDAPDARMLVVVHARGAHPPWDVTAKELGALPPPDYTGNIDPRRAAQILARARKRRSGPALGPADRERTVALEAVALETQDRALGALVGAMRTAGVWDSSLFVVTGDVSSGVSEETLFADGLPLTESLLALPLYVHFPAGAHAGTRVDAPTAVADVARTMAGALRLTLPKEVAGHDLGSVAGGAGEPWLEPQLAALGDRFAARWGDTVLTGRFDDTPRLCDLSLDPTCAFDRREVRPFETVAIFRRIVARDRATLAPPERREPVTVDADLAAMLNVWGETD